MVYNGRPSTGCGRCKDRRKKCDEARPGCLNCQKIGRACPGYPDALDLMFKNETTNVTRKAERKGKKKKDDRLSAGERELSTKASTKTNSSASPPSADANLDPAFRSSTKKSKKNKGGDEVEVVMRKSSSSSSPSPDSVEDDLDCWVGSWDPSNSLTFNPSIERQATIFFFNNFVLRSRSKEATRGFLSLLPALYTATVPTSPLTLATSALAVYTAANFPRGRHLLPHAENLYGQALRAVHFSIQDSQAATSDETLLSILLFSLYESVTSSSTENWSKHVQGAVGIVKARGMGQFTAGRKRDGGEKKKERALILFRATRTQMLTDAIQRREAIQEFPGPNGWLSDQEDDGQGGGCLIEHSIRLPNVLAKAQELFTLPHTPENASRVQALLREAYTLQHELFQCELDMPLHLGYKSMAHGVTQSTLREEEEDVLQSDVWPAGPVHIYKDVQIASIRNNNRVSQLLCTGVVIDALSYLSPTTYLSDPRYKAAAYRVQYLVDDIAASVPYHLGYRAKGEDSSTMATPTEETGTKAAGLNATGGYFLIWPLFIAAERVEVPSLQRRWMKGKLKFIAERFGMAQADVERARAGGSWSGVVSD